MKEVLGVVEREEKKAEKESEKESEKPRVDDEL